MTPSPIDKVISLLEVTVWVAAPNQELSLLPFFFFAENSLCEAEILYYKEVVQKEASVKEQGL